MNYVAYLRVSSDSQVDGFGLDAQRAAIDTWASAAGAKIKAVKRDEGVSGALSAADRPGLTECLDLLSNGTADGLIVARLDRLARALTVQEAILATVWRLDRSVVAVDQGELLPDDPDDPMRTAMRQMAGVFAELDRALVSKRLSDGRRAKAAAGRKSTGSYAYGYAGTGKGRGRDAAPFDDEQRVIRIIGDMRREGCSFRQIASRLDADGYKPRRAASWSAMTIRSIAQRQSSKPTG